MKKIGSYPSPFVDPMIKQSKEYISEYIKQMYSDFVTSNSNLYSMQKNKFVKNRNYSNGSQSSGKYKDLLQTEGDASYLNMDWTVVSIIPKFVDVVLGGMTNQEHKVLCNGIDPISVSNKKKSKARMKVDMKNKQLYKEMAEVMGVNLAADRKVLESEEEISLFMNLNYKQSTEIAMEEALDLAFYSNDWKETRVMLIRDLVDIGISVAKTESDPSFGPRIRYVDPSRFVSSYSDRPDFKNIQHAGEIKRMSIGQLRRMAPEFDEDTLQEIADKVKYKYGNDSAELNSSYRSDVQNYGQPYDSFSIEFLDAEFLSQDLLNYEKKHNKYGSYTVSKKDFKYKKPKKSKYKRENIGTTITNLYKGKWIIGTDFVFDYGLSKDMIREKSNLSETKLSYIVHAPHLRNMTTKSLVERMIPFADQIQLAHLKLQQLIAKARPKGLMIEVGGLEGVSKGDGNSVWNPLEIQSIYDQTGNFYYRRLDDDGRQMSYPPIQELENGIGKDLMSLINIYNHNLQMIRDVTGINESRDATQPSTKALVGTQKLALMASNNATRTINDAYVSMLERISVSTSLRIQDLVRYNKPYQGYVNSLGDDAMKVIEVTKDITLRDFGIKIEALPTEEEKMILENNIQQSLAQKELRIEDAILIRSVSNIKLATQMLVLRRKKYMEDTRKQAEANAQANSQQQQASIQAKAQADNQAIQAKFQMDTEKMKLEYKLKDEFAESEHQRRMDEIEAGTHLKGHYSLEQEKAKVDKRENGKDVTVKLDKKKEGN